VNANWRKPPPELCELFFSSFFLGAIMPFGLPVGELAFLAVAIIGAGVVAGLFAGLLGIGGAAVNVPGAIGYMIAGWPQQALLPPLSGRIRFVSGIASVRARERTRGALRREARAQHVPPQA
jgi:hypothetical protein